MGAAGVDAMELLADGKCRGFAQPVGELSWVA